MAFEGLKKKKKRTGDTAQLSVGRVLAGYMQYLY